MQGLLKDRARFIQLPFKVDDTELLPSTVHRENLDLKSSEVSLIAQSVTMLTSCCSFMLNILIGSKHNFE